MYPNRPECGASGSYWQMLIQDCERLREWIAELDAEDREALTVAQRDVLDLARAQAQAEWETASALCH